ncbi:Ribosomal L28e protein [Gracilaria domingensis]|nr:Ribosomal L28e protein [Gracilaria domingensis]
MQHDNVIWNSVNRHFCSYRATTVKQRFCRNKYNLTGLCEQKSCPLANSRYATIVENDDRLYLFIKTAERAHSPRRLWERIRLSANYRQALLQIDQHLQYWPQFYVHKAKQRLTKMTQYLIRKKKLLLHTKTRLVASKNKIKRREASREKKAINAAKLEASIEKELLQRLQTGAYGDIYNFAQEEYEKALDAHLDQQVEEEEEEEHELEEEHQYEAQYDDSDEDIVDDIEQIQSGTQYDFDDSDDDEEEELSDHDIYDQQHPTKPRSHRQLGEYVKEKARKREREKKAAANGKGSKGRKLRRASDGVRIEVEYEREPETQAQFT